MDYFKVSLKAKKNKAVPVPHVFSRKKCCGFQKQIITVALLFTYFHVKDKRREHIGDKKP